MDSLGVADKRPIYMYMKEMVLGEISPQNEKKSQIKIASAHKHIPRNNPAKFQNYPMDSLGGVADKGPIYYVGISKKWIEGISPKIPPK